MRQNTLKSVSIWKSLKKNSDGWYWSCVDRSALECQWNVVSPMQKSKPSTSYRLSYTKVNSDYQRKCVHKNDEEFRLENGGIYLYLLEFKVHKHDKECSWSRITMPVTEIQHWGGSYRHHTLNVPLVHTQRASPFATLRPSGQPIRRESVWSREFTF